MTISKFDKQSLDTLRAAMNLALEMVADDLNIQIDVKNMRYSDNEVKINVVAFTKDESGKTFNPLAQEFTLFCQLYGFEADDLGKTFVQGKDTYEITGLKSNNRKYPVIAKSLGNGKDYKFPADHVLKLMGREVKTFSFD